MLNNLRKLNSPSLNEQTKSHDPPAGSCGNSKKKEANPIPITQYHNLTTKSKELQSSQKLSKSQLKEMNETIDQKSNPSYS